MKQFFLSFGSWLIHILAVALLLFLFFLYEPVVVGLITSGYLFAVAVYGVRRWGRPAGALEIGKPVISYVVMVFVLWIWVFNPPFPRVPEIGRDLPSNFERAEQVFSQRVSEAFPPGTPEAVVASTLEEQGFEIDGDVARFNKSRFPCALEWRVFWSVEDGVITDISALYGAVCL